MSGQLRWMAALVFAAALSACGGGGGGGGSTPPPANTPPVANAGPDQTVNAGVTVTLSGSGTDANGTITGYQWAQTAGSSVTLSATNTASATFTAPASGPLTFRLTVTDNQGATHSDTVAININQAPTVNAGTDRTVATGATVSLTATASDSDGSIASWQWQQVSGSSVTLSGASTATLGFTAPASTGTLQFRVTVTDNLGLSASDEISVQVAAAQTSVTISGKATFDFITANGNGSLNRDNPVRTPVRLATVELLDGNTTLASTVTDNNGDYSFAAQPINRDLRVRVLSEMKRSGTPAWNVQVVDNTSSNAVYSMVTPTFNTGVSDQVQNLHAASGWNGSSWANVRPAAPFSLLDGARKSQEKILAAFPNFSFAALKLNWSVNNVAVDSNEDPSQGRLGSSYYTDGDIFILGDMSNGGDSDEHDDHVIIHEWGHYFEDRHSRSDSIGGSHSLSNKLDIRVAFGEGFGNAWSAMATDNPVYSDSINAGASVGVFFSLENNSSDSPGWASESVVQGLLYDLYDTPADGSDNLALGIVPIVNVLMGGQRTTDSMTSIFSFLHHLMIESPANAAAIRSLATARAITGSSLTEFAVGEANDGGNAAVLPVYVSHTVNGAAVRVCSVDDHKTSYVANKLGVHRFVYFNVPSAGSYTITMTPETAGADVGGWLFRRGERLSIIDDNGDNAPDSETRALEAGVHVLGVYEFGNTPELWQQPKNTTMDACFNVRVTSN